MSAGEKYKESTKTHTATTRAQRREANTAPHEATNLLQSERRGRKRKKKRSYQTFTVFFYWQCIISCFKYPIKGTEIGSLALTACAPESLEGERPKSLRLKLLVEKPRKKKKKKKKTRWLLSSLTPQGRKIPAWPQSDENDKYDGLLGF